MSFNINRHIDFYSENKDIEYSLDCEIESEWDDNILVILNIMLYKKDRLKVQMVNWLQVELILSYWYDNFIEEYIKHCEEEREIEKYDRMDYINS